jgi:tetratricopeptide (TPR) repeat protein
MPEGSVLADDGHVDNVTIAAYVEGNVPPETRREVEEHLATCQTCYEIVSELAQTVLPDIMQEQRKGRWWWIGGSAVLAAAAIILLGVRLMTTPDMTPDVLGSSRLLLAQASTAWPLEARLAAFPYLTPAPRTRSATGAGSDWNLRATAQELEERLAGDRRPEARYAAAIAMIVGGRFDEAIAGLEPLVATDNASADVLNDFAAALVSRGRLRGEVADIERSGTIIERARALDPASLEIQFNHALILEALGDLTGAQRAWRDYIERDRDSPFSAQANARLRLLQGVKP